MHIISQIFSHLIQFIILFLHYATSSQEQTELRVRKVEVLRTSWATTSPASDSAEVLHPCVPNAVRRLLIHHSPHPLPGIEDIQDRSGRAIINLWCGGKEDMRSPQAMEDTVVFLTVTCQDLGPLTMVPRLHRKWTYIQMKMKIQVRGTVLC